MRSRSASSSPDPEAAESARADDKAPAAPAGKEERRPKCRRAPGGAETAFTCRGLVGVALFGVRCPVGAAAPGGSPTCWAP